MKNWLKSFTNVEKKTFESCKKLTTSRKHKSKVVNQPAGTNVHNLFCKNILTTEIIDTFTLNVLSYGLNFFILPNNIKNRITYLGF